MWPPILRVLQSHEVKIFFGRFAQPCATYTFHFQPEHHVLQSGKPGKQFGVLKHHATIMTAAVHFAPVDGDSATTRSIETHGDAQSRGLAAAGRTDECNNLAVLDREADAIERLHVMNLAVHAQGKALGNVEESHLTHSFLQNVAQSVADDLKCLFA